ncbi:UbiD family decarboxylase [Thermodesulfobacteriota bacterium]
MEDLRDWLSKIDSIGELKKIEGVDWDQEIGAILDRKVRGEDTSALLFDSIKGYPRGYRILTSPLYAQSRVAITLNMSQSSKRELLEAIRQKLPQWEASLDKFPPKVVKTGPILENVHSAGDIDLFKFPVPKWHEHDGGRYIGTGDSVITRDPDTGEVNLGTYRVMVHDKKTTGLIMRATRHGTFHRQKYHAAGKACPVAVVLGQHPLLFGLSCLPLSGCEYNWAGAIRGEPIEILEEEVTGLPIPADSEIVIAGWIPPDKTMAEGPFGEFTGYYSGAEGAAPIIEVERIYHRNEPILLGSPPMRPPGEVGIFMALFGSAMLHNQLIKSGVPGVKKVWSSEAGGPYFTAISIKQRYPGHAKQAGLIASQSRTIAAVGRYVIVVDEDIDPTNIQDVLWALAFRSDPDKDVDIIRRCISIPLDPVIRKPTNAFFSSRAIIDACKPFEWIEEFPRVAEVSPGVADELRNKWGDVFQKQEKGAET